jgi:hypothetical protein
VISPYWIFVEDRPSTVGRASCSARIKRRGGDPKLLCPCGRVLEVLTVFRLLDTIPSFEDEAEALASFRPRGYSAKP